MPGRYLIYTPRINPDSFVFFFSRTTSDRSFSIRDYSFEPVQRRDASDFPPDVTDRTVLDWAKEPGGHCIEDIDPHPVGDDDHWRRSIAKANKLRLGKDLEIKPQASEPAGTGGSWQFPMLDLEVLQHLPKATKDIGRMQSSPRSEDWVTWNVSRLLDRHEEAVWWPRLLEAVSRQTAGPVDLPPPNRIVPWVKVPTAVAYEKASRERMATSDDPAQVTRASHPDPVEGDSEIDLVLEGDDYLIYVEAKLDSDISLATTHDPARNQLIRNRLRPRVLRRPSAAFLDVGEGPGRRPRVRSTDRGMEARLVGPRIASPPPPSTRSPGHREPDRHHRLVRAA